MLSVAIYMELSLSRSGVKSKYPFLLEFRAVILLAYYVVYGVFVFVCLACLCLDLDWKVVLFSYALYANGMWATTVCHFGNSPGMWMPISPILALLEL